MGPHAILCVDDDQGVLNAMRFLLSKNLQPDQILELAESGEEALEIVHDMQAEGTELCVVISDYIMPGMKGDELLVRIHKLLPKAITIMLTGQSDLQGVKRAINDANLYRFLEKPWNNEDVLLTVNSALRVYDMAQALEQQNAELRRMNEELEQIVAARTQELTEKNQQLEKLAITDRLTGLYNRHYLDRVCEHEFATAQRYGNAFSLILLDVDLFKQVNDQYGHAVGDAVLVDIAHILRQRVRETDVVGRWGGEEFLVICPNTTQQGACEVAEVLRERIAHHSFADVGQRSASFGVASYRADDTLTSLYVRADQALYQAKAGGRNQVKSF